MIVNPGAGVRHRFEPDKVIAITADANYSFVHLLTGQRLHMSRSLGWFNQRWPVFLRIHKHTLINPMHVREYSLKMGRHPMGYVIMTNNLRLDVSRRNIKQVRAHLEQSGTNSFPSSAS
jgi:DNA-binding LytR/AlgR family response regulator